MDLPLSAPLTPKLVWMAQAGSTNDVLAQAATGPTGSDWPDLSVVATDDQVAGRGRLGRVWAAPAGRSLAVSVLLRPPVEIDRDRWGLVPLIAGLAMARAVRGFVPEGSGGAGAGGVGAASDAVGGGGARGGAAASGAAGAGAVALKWPNDVLVGGLKVSGILGELLPDAAGIVIGAGVNLSLTSDELPTPAATSLVLAGADPAAVTVDAVLAAYLHELTQLIHDWAAHRGDPEASGLLAALIRESATLGRAVRVELPGPSFRTGTARTIDPGGRLVVDTDEGELVVAAGDVTHLRHRDS
ncbi:biotin--[acetyl-CoA-carboxylase] ligase [Herbiconiux solani]|uniref:biotin--[acetyl-CoA-carboxylase] ligase n=1 Tax=Herbiconiux solani TaxID=661329 RepID=UPI00082464A4|nr:biotin--[acetyl-CoA-carboxylase] ligase [Herbiconiux solani]